MRGASRAWPWIAATVVTAVVAAAGVAPAAGASTVVDPMLSEVPPDAVVSDQSPDPVVAPARGQGATGEPGTREKSPELLTQAIGPFAGPVVAGPTAPAPSTAPVPPLDSLVGFDTRSQVFENTGAVARMVVLITNNGNQFCTGFMIGPDTVATAAHCVHTGGPTGTWYPAGLLRVYPGFSLGSAVPAPWGSCGVRSLHAPVGWTSGPSDEHDYGAIKLDCDVGRRTGWFGWWWQEKSLDGQLTKVMGYPGDKGAQLWKAKDFVRLSEPRRVFYANDTAAGNSGSPVFRVRGSSEVGCQGPCVMAVHGYGLAGAWPYGAYNHGARVTREVSNNFFLWQSL